MPAKALLNVVEVQTQQADYRNEPRCKVCRSSYRGDVERLTVAGRTWRAIVQTLPTDADLSESNVYEHHKRGHVLADAPALAQVMRERVATLSEEADAQIDTVAEHVRLAQEVVRRVTGRLRSGELEPDLREGIAAARLLASTTDPALRSGDDMRWMAAFTTLVEVTKAFVSPEDFAEVGRIWRGRVKALADVPASAATALTDR